MALIRCRECEKQYSDKAEACPQCGCPTKYNLEVDSFEYDHEHPGRSHGRRFREEPEEETAETAQEERDTEEPSDDAPKKTEPEITKEEFEKIYVPKPHRPLFIASGLVLAAGVAGIVIAIWDMISPGSILSFRGESSVMADVFLILACLFLMAVTVVFFILRWKRYRAAQQDFESYKKKLQKLIYEKRKKWEV